MPPLDEGSRAIGRLEGKVDSLLIESKKQSEQITCIKNVLTNQRIETGSLAVGVSLITTIVVVLVKTRFFSGGGG
jgi:hypothetical protein